MKTTIKREDLLAPLQQVIGAVERRQTLPILGNILLKSTGGDLTLSATDLEIEMVANVDSDGNEDFQTTIPARNPAKPFQGINRKDFVCDGATGCPLLS